MPKQPRAQKLIARIAELGSPIDWQTCIDRALTEHDLDAIPEQKLMLRYFVAGALRHHLESTFGEEQVAPVIDGILDELGTAPRERKLTIDRARHVRRLSAMITLPPEAKKHGSTVETLGVSDSDLDQLAKLVPNVQLQPRTSSVELMNAARESAKGRQVFLIDARTGMRARSLNTLLSVLSVGQTVVWVNDPEELGLAKDSKRVVCDGRVSIEDIAALLRIAFFSHK